MFKLMRVKNLNNPNKFKNFNFKKKFIWIFILCVCNQFIKCELIQTEDKNLETPNILYIMSDDHAKNAISIYGSRLAEISPTPNIDRIGNEGIIFNHVFATNSICTPSRASILTGQYGHINGVNTLRDDFNNNSNHLGKILQKSGYNTAIIGKWHLHTEPTGFDYYNVLPGQGKYFNPMLKEKGEPWKYHNKGGKRYEGYVSDVITDESIKWLENRDKSKPFFLMSHHKAPHGLWEYAKRHENLFEKVDIPLPNSLYENKKHGPLKGEKYGSSISDRNPKRSMLNQVSRKNWPTGAIDTFGLTKKGKIYAAYQKYLKDYLRTAASIDENVGRLLDYLDKNNLSDNTMVVYTSDQGQFLGEHDYFDKRWMYEESISMPLLIRYPKKIKPKQVNNDIILNIDFAPTFLELAKQTIPLEMQGKSFLSNMQSNTPKDWRKSMYYRYWMHMASHYNPAHYGIRTKDYKLIFFYGLPLNQKGAVNTPTDPYWEFYDLKNDPNENNNLYFNDNYKNLIKKLKNELNLKKEKLLDTDEKYPELEKLKEKHWN